METRKHQNEPLYKILFQIIILVNRLINNRVLTLDDARKLREYLFELYSRPFPVK